MHSRSVLRSTLLALAATALLAPAIAAPGVAKEPADAPATEHPSVKTATRSYGQGLVYQDERDQRLRIKFRGKQGDLVTLVSNPFPGSPGCERTTLWRLDKDRRVKQKVAALWRLPRNGRFVMTYRQDCYRAVGNDEPGTGEYTASVLLTKVVPHALVPGGPAVDLGLDQDYLLHGGVLTLRDERPVRVEAVNPSPYGDTFERLLVPPSMEPRTGPGDTFDSSTCESTAPVIAQAGWGIAHSPDMFGETVLTQAACEEEVHGYVPSVGESVWFLDVRIPTTAHAVYAD